MENVSSMSGTRRVLEIVESCIISLLRKDKFSAKCYEKKSVERDITFT